MRNPSRHTASPAISRKAAAVAAAGSVNNNPQPDRVRSSHRQSTRRGAHSLSREPSRIRPQLIHSASGDPKKKNTASRPHSPSGDPPRIPLRSKADNRGPRSPPGEHERDRVPPPAVHQEPIHQRSPSDESSRNALVSTFPPGEPSRFAFQAPRQTPSHSGPIPDRLALLASNKEPMYSSTHQDPLRRKPDSSHGHPVRLAIRPQPVIHGSHSPSVEPSNLANGSHQPHYGSPSPPVSNAVIALHPPHEQSVLPESHALPDEQVQYTITPPSEPERLGLPRSPGSGHSGNTSPVMQYFCAPKVQSIPKDPPAPKPPVDTSQFVMITYTNLSIAPRLQSASRDQHQPLHAAALALHAMASVPRLPRLPPPSRITGPIRPHHDPRASVARLVHPRDFAPSLGPPPTDVLPILPPMPSSPVAQDPITVSAAAVAAAGGMREFRCHFAGCTKSFDRRYNLKVHYRRHTNETPYPCKVSSCPHKFKWRSSLAHHMRTRHKGVNITNPASSSPTGRGDGSPPSVAVSSSRESSGSGGSSPNSPLYTPARPGKVRRVGLTSFAAAVAATSPRGRQSKVHHSGHAAFVGGASTTVCDSDEERVSTPEFEQRQTPQTADSPLTEDSPPGTSSKRSHAQMRDEPHMESR